MTNAPKLSIYSDRAWLFDAAPEAIEPLFADAPRRVIPACTRLPFGSTHVVARIEEGLFATYAGFQGEFRLLTGLFGPGSILGGIKALTHAGRRMPLSLRALSDTTVRVIDAVRFREALEADKALEKDVLSYFLVMHERQIDGLLVMEYLPLADRLAMLIETLYFAMGEEPSETPVELPLSLNASDLADMLRAERASVSRVLSRWGRAGIFRREGRALYFASARLREQNASGVAFP